ncbi:MAG: M20 family metallopeptidase [Deltaproteobacteria bacterium]|nr:M20 family metallopeptidase [Deltaproteobacteria bacterium]MBW2301472.1 M20 family metallopeptidase [Deltaproteobacteria bacterium]
MDHIKAKLQKEVDALEPELKKLSYRIHAHPEVGWEEQNASRWITEYLEDGGFHIERGICGLPTAFRASYGTGKPVIAFLSEYDALPDIGHGCGHNIIASAAVGAGMASRLISDQWSTTILVMGCPAEELLGGKVILVEKGAFDDVDAALMVHPLGEEGNWAGMKSTASVSLEVEYWGRQSHAAVDPWNGINALGALLLAFNNIHALQLYFRDRTRINGIIKDGGKAVNVIPEYALGSFMIRTPKDTYLDQLIEKVIQCFEAAAHATGAHLEYRKGLRCATMHSNAVLLGLWKKNMEILGRKVGDINDSSASTDMGNVSLAVPSIHPFLSISREPMSFHTREFAAAAVSDAGRKAMADGAKGLAMTAVDIVTQPRVLCRIKEEFEEMSREFQGII